MSGEIVNGVVKLELPIQKKKDTKMTCTSCRNLHLKCDGNQPCQGCKKKQIECTYVQPKKRGPKTKELRQLKVKLSSECAELQKRILMLTEEEEKLKKQDEKKSKVKDFFSLSLQKLPRSQNLILDSLFRKYMDHYFEFFHPIMAEVVDQKLYSGLDRSQAIALLENLDPYTNKLIGLQMNAMLSLSARMCGDVKEADEIFKIARRFLSSVFDENDMIVAQSLIIMSYIQHCLGNVDKSETYSQLALQICKNLNNFDSPTFRIAVTTLVFKERDTEKRKFLLKCNRLHQSPKNERIMFCFVSLWVTHLLEPHAVDFNMLCNALNESDSLLKQVQQENINEHAKSTQILFLYCIKLIIYQITCLNEQAFMYANNILDRVDTLDTRCYSMSVFMAVAVTTRFHVLINRKDLLIRDFQTLYKFTKFLPVANMLLKTMEIELSIKFNPLTCGDDSISLSASSILLKTHEIDCQMMKYRTQSNVTHSKTNTLIQFYQYLGIPPEDINIEEVSLSLYFQDLQLKFLEKNAPNFLLFFDPAQTRKKNFLRFLENHSAQTNNMQLNLNSNLDPIHNPKVLESINYLRNRTTRESERSPRMEDVMNFNHLNSIIMSNISINDPIPLSGSGTSPQNSSNSSSSSSMYDTLFDDFNSPTQNFNFHSYNETNSVSSIEGNLLFSTFGNALQNNNFPSTATTNNTTAVNSNFPPPPPLLNNFVPQSQIQINNSQTFHQNINITPTISNIPYPPFDSSSTTTTTTTTTTSSNQNLDFLSGIFNPNLRTSSNGLSFSSQFNNTCNYPDPNIPMPIPGDSSSPMSETESELFGQGNFLIDPNQWLDGLSGMKMENLFFDM